MSTICQVCLNGARRTPCPACAAKPSTAAINVNASPIEQPPIDWSKPVFIEERPENKCRVLCTDAPGEFPVLVLEYCGEVGNTWRFRLNGALPTPHSTIRNIPEPEQVIERWVNVYVYGGTASVLHKTREDADTHAESLPRIACVPVAIRYRNGEGL